MSALSCIFSSFLAEDGRAQLRDVATPFLPEDQNDALVNRIPPPPPNAQTSRIISGRANRAPYMIVTRSLAPTMCICLFEGGVVVVLDSHPVGSHPAGGSPLEREGLCEEGRTSATSD